MAGARPGIVAVASLALLCTALPCVAAPIPSKPATDPIVASQPTDRSRVEAFLATNEVKAALASRGLAPQDVEQRVARLSEADVAALAANLDQIQSAGEVPQYIWILLAVFLGVAILATVF